MSPASTTALSLGSIAGLRRLLVFAMTALGYAALHFSGELPIWAAVLFAVSTLVAWGWREGRVNFARWKRPWTALTLGFFALTIVRMVQAEEFDLMPGVHFAIFLATAKLFQLAQEKDYPQSMALSLILMAGATAVNDQLSFGVIFGIYVFTSTLSLTVNHLCAELESRGGAPQKTRMDRVLLWPIIGLAALVFAGSIAFFFAFPRVGFGFFNRQERSGVLSSGFGDDVELGAHGTIRGDATVVLRVTFPEGPPQDPRTLYFRGLSLDHFTGRGWRDEENERRQNQYDDTAAGYKLWPWGSATWEEATAGTSVADIYQEPLGSDVLFSLGIGQALGLPDGVTGLPQHIFGRALQVDSTNQIRLLQRSSVGTRYRIWSRDNALPIDSPVPPLGPRRIARYLQLPDEVVTPRMQALVDEIRAANPSDAAFVRAVEAHLLDFAYTTDLPRPAPGQNLSDAFLFEWQRGHCEYFATGMAVLLRAGGVPVRIVNGFLGADYNDVGGYWTVRQANAHSWVEVYFPETGWQRFDPTPAGAAEVDMGGVLGRFGMFLDNMRFHWFRWVIEYNLEKQVNTIRDAMDTFNQTEAGEQVAKLELGQWLRRVGRWLFPRFGTLFGMFLLWLGAVFLYRRRGLERHEWGRVDWSIAGAWLTLIVALLLARWPRASLLSGLLIGLIPMLLTTWLARELRRGLFEGPQSRKRRSRGSERISVLYARLLRSVEKHQGDQPVSITPQELTELLEALPPELQEDLRIFLESYSRVRFAGEQLDTAHEKELDRRLRRILRGIRRMESSRP